MWETITIQVSLTNFLIVEASICINQDHTENKMGRHSEINSQDPAIKNTRSIL